MATDLETDTVNGVRLERFSSSDPNQHFSLPPSDEGRAWAILFGNFCIDAIVWGLPFTFGVFQEHYASLEEFAGDAGQISTIGTVATGVLYMICPVSTLLLRQFPRHLGLTMFIGLAVVCSSLVLASFSTKVWQLIITQGMFYAIGASMLSYPGLILVDQWFVRRKATAYGISWASIGAAGLILPFLFSWSLATFGFRTTLRWWAVLNLLLVGPMIFLFKPRIPPSTSTRFVWPDLRYVVRHPFAGLQLGILLQSLGYFLPTIYLPSYARSLGMNQIVAVMTVILLNVGTILGCPTFGFLLDRWSTSAAVLVAATGAALSVLIFWGLSGAAAMLCIFAFVYGLCTGASTATWAGIVRDTIQQHPSVESGFAYSLLVSARGIGNLVSGPLSAALLHATPVAGGMSYGYGSRYGALITFTGVTAFLGSIGFFTKLYVRLR